MKIDNIVIKETLTKIRGASPNDGRHWVVYFMITAVMKWRESALTTGQMQGNMQ